MSVLQFVDFLVGDFRSYWYTWEWWKPHTCSPSRIWPCSCTTLLFLPFNLHLLFFSNFLMLARASSNFSGCEISSFRASAAEQNGNHSFTQEQMFDSLLKAADQRSLMVGHSINPFRPLTHSHIRSNPEWPIWKVDFQIILFIFSLVGEGEEGIICNKLLLTIRVTDKILIISRILHITKCQLSYPSVCQLICTKKKINL